MKSMLLKALLWCALTTLLPSITSGKPLDLEALRRLKDDSTALLTHRSSGADSPLPPQRSLRVKRTEPVYAVKRVERAGCNLATCSVHDLAHLLHMMHTKTNSAPPDKIGSNGYGRRRRRSAPPNRAVLAFQEGRLKLAWVRTLKRPSIRNT